MKLTDVEREVRKSRKVPGLHLLPRSAEGYIEVKVLNYNPSTRYNRREHFWSTVQQSKYDALVPRGKRPGKWSPKTYRAVLCRSGWHVTLNASRWGATTARGQYRYYVIEGKGQRDGSYDPVLGYWPRLHSGSDFKRCYQQIRLVREVTHKQAMLIQKINRAIWQEKGKQFRRKLAA